MTVICGTEGREREREEGERSEGGREKGGKGNREVREEERKGTGHACIIIVALNNEQNLTSTRYYPKVYLGHWD